jgi:hypothetical protein
VIRRLFGLARPPATSAGSLGFKESASRAGVTKSANEPRRELVKMALRECLRRHGISAEWIDCRTLSVKSREQKSGLHVQFLVRKSDEQLLPYVHAFQESFMGQIGRVDPSAKEWLFSVSWQFFGKATRGFSAMPAGWREEAAARQKAEQAVMGEDSGGLSSDLQALQAVITQPAELTELQAAPARTSGRSARS